MSTSVSPCSIYPIFTPCKVYAYLTPNRASWLGDLIRGDARWLQVPFSRLVLPGSHDSGMFIRLDPGLATFIASGKLGDAFGHEAIMAIANPAAHILIKVLETFKYRPDAELDNLANTQKDPFPNQLRMGVRYFDVRPGYCFYDVINLKKGELHHQHSFVPGAAYIDFLTNVLEFLDEHPQEIVFAEIKKSGFLLSHDVIHDGKLVAYSMIPSVEELAAVLEQARTRVANRTAKRIEVGTAADLDRPIGQLIDENRRFFMLDKMHEPDAWPKADSYNDKAYGTKDPASIIAQLDKTYNDSQSQPDTHPGDCGSANGKAKRGAIYQLQATPQVNIKEDIITGLRTSDAGSLLVYMKPKMDRVTYPWIESKTFNEPGNIILLNDFVEGLLVEHAIMKSKDRAGS
ncbi:hypothetical protein FRB95_004452 [Tulasnella sp. JGI-2019a]|nr:hypothetical protein FRB95_004452 [Tulasnella sp. JGI-2019a]